MDVSILRMLGGMVVQQVGRLMDAPPMYRMSSWFSEKAELAVLCLGAAIWSLEQHAHFIAFFCVDFSRNQAMPL